MKFKWPIIIYFLSSHSEFRYMKIKTAMNFLFGFLPDKLAKIKEVGEKAGFCFTQEVWKSHKGNHINLGHNFK